MTVLSIVCSYTTPKLLLLRYNECMRTGYEVLLQIEINSLTAFES